MKKLIAVMLLIALIFTMSGCGSGKEQGEKSESIGKIIEESQTTRTVVDQAGRRVEVPKESESFALCYRVIVRFLLNLEQGEKIKGIGKTEPFLVEVEPSLAEAVDVGKGVVDIEALAKLEPDIFFHKASDRETLEAVQKLGIPAIGINVETPEDMLVAIELMGNVCGAQEKAETLISYYRGKIAKAKELTQDIKNKKTAVVMGSSLGKVATDRMLQGEMLAAAGAINGAQGISTGELWPTVGTEEIFQWDPEYIFIGNNESANYTVEDILTDANWSELTAVKNKNVYLLPAEADPWDFPGVVSGIGIDYMIHILYPELLSRQSLEENVTEFYQIAYGITAPKGW
ncbi:MAG: ABC transporter substrate-binding protein [Anaerovoracaceae bacterium]